MDGCRHRLPFMMNSFMIFLAMVTFVRYVDLNQLHADRDDDKEMKLRQIGSDNITEIVTNRNDNNSATVTVNPETETHCRKKGRGRSYWNSTRKSRHSRNRCFERDGSYTVGLKAKMILVPIFTTIGLVGNSLSFAVWSSRVYAGKSYTYYLRSLAVFDNLTLIITCLATFEDLCYCLNGYQLFWFRTELSCKLSSLLRNAIYLMSSWMVACFTVDRYVAVCHPFHRCRLSTARGAAVVITVLAAAAVLTQTYTAVFVGLREWTWPSGTDSNASTTTSLRFCDVKNPVVYDPENNTVLFRDFTPRIIQAGLENFWFNFTLRFFLPFVVIAVCNGRIIAELRRLRHGPVVGRGGDRTGKANTAIYTLYIVCAVFVITLLPHACLSMIWFVIFTPKLTSKQKVRMGMFRWARKVSVPFELILLCNYTFNFLLYGLAGGQFRKTIVSILSCRRPTTNRSSAVAIMMKPVPPSRTGAPGESTALNGTGIARV